MYDNLIDHEQVRARVEKRLEPRLRLMRQRSWLLVHIAVFVFIALVFAAMYGNPFFYSKASEVFPATTWTDHATGEVFTSAGYTVDTYTPYLLVSLVSFLWPVLLIAHIFRHWTDSRRERVIEREMEKELELERLRLQLELTNANSGELEKPKRRVGLSDEGEIVSEDIDLRRRNNRRH